MSVEVDATVSTQVAVGGNWGAARGLDDTCLPTATCVDIVASTSTLIAEK